MREHEITGVLFNSIAHELDISIGDHLISIDGLPVRDYFDYLFYNSAEVLTLEIRKSDNSIEYYDIEKYEDESLGLVFVDDLMDKQRSCANKCIFCFVDQLPRNLRETLYYKDDDWRLSILTGNFITLTNCTDKEIDRIIKLKVSPLYISVHTTNPQLRIKMTGNRNAGGIYDILKRFTKNKMSFHCRIVLCPSINDADELENTCNDLAKLYPYCRSVAVVPVGLTDHRIGLAEIKPMDLKCAQDTINRVAQLQTKFYDKFNDNFVYMSDEMYIKGEIELPPYESYGEFEQIENGVGLVRKFEHEFMTTLPEMPKELYKDFTICTGISAYRFIQSLVESAIKHTVGLKINVIPIQNKFFGENITVSGLLTGSDIILGLKDKILGQSVLIPSNMLKCDSDIFLDDMSVSELSDSLGVEVLPAGRSGYELINAIYGEIGECCI